MPMSLWSDVSAIANAVQEDAYFIVRQMAVMPRLVTTYNDMTGGNLRKNYAFNSVTVNEAGEADDIVHQAFTPSAAQTLTPIEITAGVLVTDLRRDSELPESIMADAARELGMGAVDKIETDLCGDMASLTGGTIGAAGTVITWGYVAAAITRARAANKSNSIPLACVIHAYQAAVLAKAASVAGASVVNGPALQDAVNAGAMAQVFSFLGVPVYQSFTSPTGTDFTGGVFPRASLALDWRRPIRIEVARDASRRGTEINMSAVYAHGVWRPELGVKMTFDAAAPTA